MLGWLQSFLMVWYGHSKLQLLLGLAYWYPMHSALLYFLWSLFGWWQGLCVDPYSHFFNLLDYELMALKKKKKRKIWPVYSWSHHPHIVDDAHIGVTWPVSVSAQHPVFFLCCADQILSVSPCCSHMPLLPAPVSRISSHRCSQLCNFPIPGLAFSVSSFSIFFLTISGCLFSWFSFLS